MQLSLIKGFKKKMGSDLGKDITVTMLSQMTVMVLALVLNKLLSVMLGVEGYGQYSIIKKNASVLSFVMLSGMGIALPRYLSIYTAQKDFIRAKSTVMASLLVILMVSSVILAICLGMNPQLSSFLVGKTDLQLYLSVLLFAVSITLSSLLFAYYRGVNAFMNFGISQIAIQVLIIIGTLFYGHSLVVVINLWSITTILYVLGSMIIENKKNALYKENPVSWKGDVSPQLSTLFKYGIPRLVGDFFLFSFAAFPLVAINQRMGIRASSYFATGITLTAIITTFFSFLGMILLPYVSTAIAQHKFKQADQFIKQLSIAYLVLALMAILIGWFGMDLFIRLFFSAEFLPSGAVSRIILLSVLFESIYLLLRNPLDAVSTFPHNTVNLLISFVVLVVLFSFSKTLEEFAVSFLLATALKSVISFFTWQWCRKKILLDKG